MSEARSGRTKLLLLAALFFAPVVGAITLFFYLPQYIPAGRVNHGTLVSPARPLPSLGLVDAQGVAAPAALQGKWTLLYLGDERCEEACIARLVLSRQVRLALNEKRARVQRAYLAPSVAAAAAAKSALAAEHPDLVFVAGDRDVAARFFQPGEPQALYLIDPLGNWLMVYTGAIEHKGLHRDLKKLLRISQVG